MTTIPRAAFKASTGTATLSSGIVDQLRLELLKGVIAPGTKLRVDDLKVKFQVSLTPVREALMRLTAEGLVIAEDQRGFRVAPVSTQNLREITELRDIIECLALRHAIANADIDWETEIVATLHRLNAFNSRRGGDDVSINEDWERWRRQFHMALTGACRMPLMLSFCKTLHDLSDRCRRIFLPVLQPVDRQEQHANIAQAACSRNAYLAVKLLSEHIRQTEALIANAIESRASASPEESGVKSN